jgi:hypothetical protein
VSFIEIETYLVIDPDEFVAADATVQEAVVYQAPGLRRRTTAKGSVHGSVYGSVHGDVRWVTITLWDSHELAEQSHQANDNHPLEQARRAYMTDRHVEVFTTL